MKYFHDGKDHKKRSPLFYTGNYFTRKQPKNNGERQKSDSISDCDWKER